MKKVILIALVTVLAFSYGCKKDSSDSRDQYVGTWKGTMTVIIPGLSINASSDGVNTYSKSTLNSNKVIITSGTDIENVTVNGNSYVYDQYTVVDNSTGNTITYVINGNGTISGNTIVEIGTLTVSANGGSYPGSWTSTMNRQ